MNRLFVLVSLLFGITELAQAQYQGYLWFEPQVTVQKSEFGKTTTGEYFGTISAGQKFSPRFGLILQTAHGNWWGETVFGPSFTIAPGLEISPAIGFEHYAPRLLRFRLNGYYDHTDTGSFVYTEIDFGKTGNWVATEGARMFGPVGIGGIVQMPGGGAGPKIEIRAGKTALWVAPVHDWQEKTTRLLVGTRLMFDW